MSTIPCYFCKYGRKKYQRLLIVAFSVSNQLKPSSRPQTIHLQPSTTIHPITQQITQKPTKLLGALVPHVFFCSGVPRNHPWRNRFLPAGNSAAFLRTSPTASRRLPRCWPPSSRRNPRIPALRCLASSTWEDDGFWWVEMNGNPGKMMCKWWKLEGF